MKRKGMERERGSSNEGMNIPRSAMGRVVMSCSWFWHPETWREECGELPPSVPPEGKKTGKGRGG